MTDIMKAKPEQTRPTIEIVRNDYQPSKSELEADVSLHNVPGETIHERARNLAKALIRPVNVVCPSPEGSPLVVR